MTKKELIGKVVDVLKENDIKKNVTSSRNVLHISDDNGNHTDFVVKKPERKLLYTVQDVTSIIDACLAIIEDCMKHGEPVTIHGFGTLHVHYRAARKTQHPLTKEDVPVPPHYVPKFTYGNTLRMAAQIYEASVFTNKDGVK